MKTIKGIVFDSDGTLLDTRELVLAGYERTLIVNGFEELASRELVRKHLGKPVFETYEKILGKHGHEKLIHELTQQHEEIQDTLVDSVKAYVDLPELISFLQKFELFVCLNTSGTTRQVWRNFRAVGHKPSDLFDLVVTADNNLARKPNPEAIHYIGDVLDVRPDELIVVGDHTYDIKMGRAANVYNTIGLTHGFGTRAELDKAQADKVFDSLTEVKSYLKNMLLAQMVEQTTAAK